MADEYRRFDGEIKLLAQPNKYIYEVEAWLLNTLVNRNKWQYIDLERHRPLFAGTPLLVAYTNNGQGIGDGHNYRLRIGPDGEERPSFTDATAERIVGALSENQADIRLEDRDGVTWIVGKGYLWRWYAPELTEKIEHDAVQGRAMSVSIETLVSKSHMEGDVEVMENYTILGTTILGDHVTPAVDGARVTALQAMEDEFKELKLRAASYQQPVGDDGKKPQKTNLNKGVRTRMNDKTELEIAQEKVVSLQAELDQAHGETEAAKQAGEEKANALQAELDEAKATIETMKQAEHERRVQSVKDALASAAKEIGEYDSSTELDDAVKELTANAEEYAAMEKDGKFCGSEAARKDLMAVYGAKTAEYMKALRKSQKQSWAFDAIQNEKDEDGIAGLLKSFGID